MASLMLCCLYMCVYVCVCVYLCYVDVSPVGHDQLMCGSEQTYSHTCNSRSCRESSCALHDEMCDSTKQQHTAIWFRFWIIVACVLGTRFIQ